VLLRALAASPLRSWGEINLDTGNTSAYAIETHNLSRVFGDRVAVDNLTLAIPPGKVFGFLGPNGAGKTTTLRMLATLIAPTSGSARVAGYDVGTSSNNKGIRRSLGFLTDTPGLYGNLTAMQNLLFFAGLYEVPERTAAQRAERYLKMLDLWDRRDDKVGGFSKGMRQKVALVRALLHEPQVIFLDEPTAGLDPEAARTVHQFIANMRDEGRSVLLTTHNLTEADALCDLIGVFRTRLLRLDTPANLRSQLFGTGTLVQLAGDASSWVATARSLPFVRDAQPSGDTLTITLDNPDAQNPVLLQALVGAGAQVRYVRPITPSLEAVYLELIEASKAQHPDAE
jgi:ABC-2 type transport system ATP-binding protein